LAANAKSKSKGKASKATKGKGKAKAGGGVDQRLVKALAHELRVQILTILNERMASPNELAKELDEGLSQVSYHVKVLRDYECIELVKTEPRRGAVEHYYRATSRAFLTDRDWKRLPASVKPGMSAKLMQLIINDAAMSLQEGTFDAREDRHLSWTPVILDDKGWSDLTKAIAANLDEVMKIQKQSAARLTKSGEDGYNVSVAMMAFEVPASQRTAKKTAKKPARKTAKKASRKPAKRTRKTS
jgi:DNA-binding transcriptional ArsR family regulator